MASTDLDLVAVDGYNRSKKIHQIAFLNLYCVQQEKARFFLGVCDTVEGDKNEQSIKQRMQG